MRSRVSKLYDYTQAEIPAGLRLWRITEEQIDGQLASLSRTHAAERDVDEVRAGDSVVCRGESAVGRWNKPVLLFYPGSGLCEKAIEDALVGMRPGESRTVAASEGEAALTVSRIVRREAHPIDDELVKLEAVEGVETLADYRRWYRESTEKWNRDHRVFELARHLLEEMVEKSEYEIDEAEELAWASDAGKQMRAFDEMQGIDPTVPEEGTEFLTEEQVIEKYIKQCRPRFRGFVAYPAIAAHLSGLDGEELLQTCVAEEEARWEKFFNSLSPEEQAKIREQQERAKEQAPEEVSEDQQHSQLFFNKAEELLRGYSEKLVEE